MSQEPTAATEPPRRFVVRGRQGLELFSSHPDPISAVSSFPKALATCYKQTSDGSIAIVADDTSIYALSLRTFETLWKAERPNVKSLTLSPLNTYVVSWEAQTESNKDGNLIVWRIADGSVAAKFSHKSNGEWVKWNFDETIFARLATSELHFYDGRTMPERFQYRLTLPGLSDFSLSPQNHPVPCVAVFVKSPRKDSPSSIKLFNYPLFNPTDAFVTKSFFKAESVKILWSPSGKSLLVETQTEVDTSGKSYYGETNMFFISRDGKNECNIEFQKEGPIHDFAWSPSGKEFIVVQGFTPAKAIMYDMNARPVFDFGAAPRNFVSWSPHGRFVCLAGFGNLAGEIDIWDKQKSKKVGECVSNCAVSFEWSPCSRYFTTATLFPRLRVDNGVNVWKHNGTLLQRLPFQEIYEVKWQPAPTASYRDRAASPKRPGASSGASSEASSASSPSPTPTPQAAPAKVGAYVPPHLRNNPALAQSTMTGLKREEQVAKKIEKPVAAPTQVYPVGYTPTKADEKKKKDQERRQQKKEQQELLAKIEAAKKAEEEQKKAEAAAAAAAEESADPIDPTKRLKALQKKLRQIEQLKEKQQSGVVLNAEQLGKLQALDEITHEIELLQIAEAKK